MVHGYKLKKYTKLLLGVGVTIERSEEDEKLAVRCVLLVRMYGVFDSVFT